MCIRDSDNAVQRGQVVRGALLRAGEHGNDGRYTDQERDVVLRGIFQAALRCKIAQNDNFAARIEGRRSGCDEGGGLLEES